MIIEDKINIVKDILENKKVAIGFSGGADSTLMAYLSSKVASDTLAITIDNHIFPEGFIEHAKAMTQSFGISHEIIDINFYDDEEFLSNLPSRCYTCRNLMYNQIKQMAVKKGFDFICDGNNISDLVNDRPGILITYKNDFKTPFIEAKLTSKEIHEYLDKNNIPYSRSTTCLATRIPTNTPVSHEKIERTDYSENYILTNTDCEIVKVRDSGEIAIVEVDKINEILRDNKFNLINDELKKQGYSKVALNLSQIDDNEYISIDYGKGSFSYQLPYTINLENTKKQMENIISDDEDKIETDKITIFKDGLIKGHDLESYELALDTFMEILPKLRRNI
ncbi:ATP-dependent sacrificial sulfur transferase LarE [Methanobrevibacter sp.]|uniref:ATP-dependent sacrificial sulfur transferase LarE n=1 Tax=Methanobrevibacter sp. TaxID=66852 RepID=UPI00386E2C44